MPARSKSISTGRLAAAALAACCVALPARRARAQGEVAPPAVVQHVDAVYPRSALQSRIHGDVLLTVTVDADGHVSKVEVAESGGRDLD